MANVDLQEIVQQWLQGKKHSFVWIMGTLMSFLTKDQDRIQVEEKAERRMRQVNEVNKNNHL